VFASGDDLDGTRWPALRTKHDIERSFNTQLQEQRVVHLRTAFFYENFVAKAGERRVSLSVDSGADVTSDDAGDPAPATTYVFTLPLDPDMKIPMLSCADVGTAAAEVVLAPLQFVDNPSPGSGKPAIATYDLVADVVSPTDLIRAFEGVTSRHARYERLGLASLDAKAQQGDAMSAAIASMYRWYELGHPGHERNVEAIRSHFNDLMGLDEWMRSDQGAKSICKGPC
jgi:hypothetical protein